MADDILDDLADIGHSDDERHYRALGNLHSGGDAARDQLIARLPTAPRHQRWQIITVLAGMGDEPSWKALRGVVRDDPDPVLRNTAIPGLKGAIDAETVAVLVIALKDRDNVVRRWAASHLALAKDPATVALLTAALKDRDEWVQYHAASALHFANVPQARAKLETLGKYAHDQAVQRCARQTLFEWDHPKNP